MLGYERVDKYNHLFDVLVTKEEEGYTLQVPHWPEKNFSMGQIQFIALEDYRKNGDKDKGMRQVYKMESGNRAYLVMRLDTLRDNVILRLVEFEETGQEYLVRVHLEEVVRKLERNTDTPEVFYNTEGDMELEETFKETLQREVNIVGVTNYKTGEVSETTQKELQEILTEGLIYGIIKEAGDSEISLAVTRNKII